MDRLRHRARHRPHCSRLRWSLAQETTRSEEGPDHRRFQFRHHHSLRTHDERQGERERRRPRAWQWQEYAKPIERCFHAIRVWLRKERKPDRPDTRRHARERDGEGKCHGGGHADGKEKQATTGCGAIGKTP